MHSKSSERKLMSVRFRPPHQRTSEGERHSACPFLFLVQEMMRVKGVRAGAGLSQARLFQEEPQGHLAVGWVFQGSTPLFIKIIPGLP